MESQGLRALASQPRVLPLSPLPQFILHYHWVFILPKLSFHHAVIGRSEIAKCILAALAPGQSAS